MLSYLSALVQERDTRMTGSESSLIPALWLKAGKKGVGVRANNWRPHQSGTLQGFFDLVLDSGLEIRGMTVHEKEDKRWVSFPSRPYEAEDGTTKYQPILRIEDDARWRAFQKQAQQAIEAVMGNGQGDSENIPF